MRFLPVHVALALLALLLAVPTAALAQAEPDMMEDPVEAMEPEIDVAPVEPAMPEADGIAEAGVVETTPEDVAASGSPTSTAAVAVPTYTATAGSGQLPFTGLDPRQVLQLFLVGSVLISGGIVSIAWGRARSETT